MLRADQLDGHPALVIWSLDRVISLTAIEREARRLQERWQPAPLLLLLPAIYRLIATRFSRCPQRGCFRTPTWRSKGRDTLLNGGRVVDVNDFEHRTHRTRLLPWDWASGCW